MNTSFQPDRAYAPVSSVGSNTVSVSIAKPAELGLADWMSQLRDWLDHQGIEPAGFKCNDGACGNQIYEVSLHDRKQADLFAAEFNKSTFDKNLNPGDRA